MKDYFYWPYEKHVVSANSWSVMHLLVHSDREDIFIVLSNVFCRSRSRSPGRSKKKSHKKDKKRHKHRRDTRSYTDTDSDSDTEPDSETHCRKSYSKHKKHHKHKHGKHIRKSERDSSYSDWVGQHVQVLHARQTESVSLGAMYMYDWVSQSRWCVYISEWVSVTWYCVHLWLGHCVQVLRVHLWLGHWVSVLTCYLVFGGPRRNTAVRVEIINIKCFTITLFQVARTNHMFCIRGDIHCLWTIMYVCHVNVVGIVQHVAGFFTNYF